MKRIIKLFAVFLCLSATAAAGTIRLGTGNRIPGIASFPGKTADTAWVNYYVRKGFSHLTKKSYDLEKVLAYIDTACLVCEKEEFDFPSSLHLLRAEYFYETGDFSRSETEASLAVKKAENEMKYLLQARSLIFLGRYYLRTGFYQASIDQYNKSIALADEKDLKGIKPRSYAGQAEVFLTVSDYKAYMTNLRKMVEVSLAENDTLDAEEGLLRLGTILTEDQRDFRKADSTLKECIRLALIKKDTYYAAYAMANTGWNFYRQKMPDSAIIYYQKSLNYSSGRSANALGNLGTIYRDLGDYNRALKFYTKSLDIANESRDWYSLSWVYKDMSDLYLTREDTSGAFKSYVLYKQFNDSVLSKKSTLGLAEARIRYDADAHNKEIDLLELRLKNNSILNTGYTIVVVSLIVIGLLIFRSRRLNEKRRISEMNHKISEMTQANLRQQMNPHFIFNTLNSIQYYMYQNDKVATNNYLTKFSSLMRKVLDNSQSTSVPLRDELDALNLYLELECLRFKDKFEFKITVDDEIDPLMYKVPTMLIQPYVENSICHGLIPMEGKGFVNINLKLTEACIVCTIEDNGIGREAATELRKKKEKNHNSLGTQIATSRLELVNSLYGTSLKTVYTDLKNEKGEADGTRVEIHIPILT
ncbi:MAG: tetratricopeptide repeat protein [Bacteroidia bacterium]|nr:tetratricopeptide repeat protein [Bacteroidia bacterium]